LVTLEWKTEKHTAPEELYSIDEHTTSLYEDKLYVFGGKM